MLILKSHPSLISKCISGLPLWNTGSTLETMFYLDNLIRIYSDVDIDFNVKSTLKDIYSNSKAVSEDHMKNFTYTVISQLFPPGRSSLFFFMIISFYLFFLSNLILSYLIISHNFLAG